MLVYRISKEQYCRDLSGEGARLFGGRWNMIGTPCVYTSQSRALALLEFSVNVNFDFIPPRLFFTVIEIDDALIDTIPIEELPNNWKAVPVSSTTKMFGTEKMKLSKFPVLRFPSVVIPNEFNYILNPNGLNDNCFKIISIEPYDYDFRIKK